MRAYGLGRLTKDFELRHSTSGTAFTSNSIACDRRFGEKTTDFFEIKAFGKTAEAMEKFLHKGSKVFVEGDLQVDSYTDKNGNKRQNTVIMVSNWEFAESKSADAPKAKTDDFLSIPEGLTEELPFA